MSNHPHYFNDNPVGHQSLGNNWSQPDSHHNHAPHHHYPSSGPKQQHQALRHSQHLRGPAYKQSSGLDSAPRPYNEPPISSATHNSSKSYKSLANTTLNSPSERNQRSNYFSSHPQKYNGLPVGKQHPSSSSNIPLVGCLEPTSPTATPDPSSMFNNIDGGGSRPARSPRSGNSVALPDPHRQSGGVAPPPPGCAVSEEFERIRTEYRHKAELYCDSSFPPIDSSLYFSKKPPFAITWMRPTEIARQYNTNPEFRSRACRSCDLKQGELGDCWVVASVACLLIHDSDQHQLLSRLVPPGQSFSPSWYAGVFCFRFWRFGQWQEVIIDDLLPTNSGRLVFVHSAQVNEFWGALLEKAYAKLNGSYEALKSGLIGDAMNDLTGGMTELYSLEFNAGKSVLPPKDIDDVLIKAFDRHSLVGAGIKDKSNPAVPSGNHGANLVVNSSSSRILSNGLVSGHAYALTDTRKIRLTDEGGERIVTLVRVRNPWPSDVQWNGAWSEQSPEWLSIPLQDRANVGLVKGEGEFWISLDDLLTHFDTLYLCHLPPHLNPSTSRLWTTVEFQSAWKRGVSAGGRPFLRQSHWTNPQFRVMLSAPDPGDPNGHCNLIVGLMQRDRRHLKVRPSPLVSIGFILYKAPTKMAFPLPREFFEQNSWIVSVDFFVNAREVVKRFRLPPGNYVMLPCTYEANHEAEFLLRVFFEYSEHYVDYPENQLENHQIVIPDPTPVLDTKIPWLKRLFYEESGDSMMLDAFQLQRVLNTLLREERFYLEISVDACKSLVSMLDSDLSFRISEQEFGRLWNYLHSWVRTFAQLDLNKAGSISVVDLRNGFSNLGYVVPQKLLIRITHRFADSAFRISFSNFISILALLRKVHDSYKRHESPGKVILSLEEFFEVALTM